MPGTSKEMKCSTPPLAACWRCTSTALPRSGDRFLTCIRQNTPAYASISQNTSAYVSIRRQVLDLAAADAAAVEASSTHVLHEDLPEIGLVVACIRQHTSAYVSIRQAYGSICQHTSVPAMMLWFGMSRGMRLIRFHSCYISIREHT